MISHLIDLNSFSLPNKKSAIATLYVANQSYKGALKSHPHTGAWI